MASTLLLDLDGVLVDSIPATERAWTAWARRVGLEPARVLDDIHGRRAIDSVRALMPELDAEEEHAWIERAEVEDTDGVTPLPGARELLAELRPGEWAVVTSGTRPLAIARLRAAGLDVPEALVSAEDVTAGKPAPDPYLRGAERLGSEPGECLVVEDAPPGVLAGKAAGMVVWAVLTTHPAGELEAADARFPTLVELRERLGRRPLG
jgi:mannitol-1-/sugar-/sorbitol-6-phosphatase